MSEPPSSPEQPTGQQPFTPTGQRLEDAATTTAAAASTWNSAATRVAGALGASSTPARLMADQAATATHEAAAAKSAFDRYRADAGSRDDDEDDDEEVAAILVTSVDFPAAKAPRGPADSPASSRSSSPRSSPRAVSSPRATSSPRAGDDPRAPSATTVDDGNEPVAQRGRLRRHVDAPEPSDDDAEAEEAPETEDAPETEEAPVECICGRAFASANGLNCHQARCTVFVEAKEKALRNWWPVGPGYWSFDLERNAWVPTAEDSDFRVTGEPCGDRVADPDGRRGTVVGVGEVEDEGGALQQAYRVVYDDGEQGDLYDDALEAGRAAEASIVASKAPAAESGPPLLGLTADHHGLELTPDGRSWATFGTSKAFHTIASRHSAVAEGGLLPKDCETLYGDGAPGLFEALKLSRSLKREIADEACDLAAARRLAPLVDAEMPWLRIPEKVSMRNPAHVDMLKRRLRTWVRTGRRLGDLMRGVSHYRVLELTEEHLERDFPGITAETRALDKDCCKGAEEAATAAGHPNPGEGCCEMCALIARSVAAEKARGQRKRDGRSSSMEPADAVTVEAVAKQLADLIPTAEPDDPVFEECLDDESRKRSFKPGEGPLIADHVKWWPILRMWCCKYCNTHITWVLDTFPEPESVLQKAVVSAYILLKNLTSVRARG